MTDFNPSDIWLNRELAKQHPFGPLGFAIKWNLQNDYDAKVILTSHNSKPGVGKTTLAIHAAREWDQSGEWSAEDKAVMSGGAYQSLYEEVEPGSVILFDEIEGAADSRRAMSHQNVNISQAWAQNRYRNVCTIATLPTVSMLDNRLLEMADFWVNVLQRGRAKPHHIKVNDYDGSIYRDPLDGHIMWSDLPNDDPDYNLLKDMKHKRRKHEDKHYRQEEVDKIADKVEKTTKMEYRNDLIRDLANGGGLTTYEIAELDQIDLSQGRVSQIVNEGD